MFLYYEYFYSNRFHIKKATIKEKHNYKMTDYWKNKNMDFYLLVHEYIFIFKM